MILWLPGVGFLIYFNELKVLHRNVKPMVGWVQRSPEVAGALSSCSGGAAKGAQHPSIN